MVLIIDYDFNCDFNLSHIDPDKKKKKSLLFIKNKINIYKTKLIKYKIIIVCKKLLNGKRNV